MASDTFAYDAPEATGTQGPLHLGALVQIAWRRKSFILLGVVACLILGALYWSMASPVYEAKTQVLVVRKQVYQVLGVTAGAMEDYIATQAGIIKSPEVVRRAVNNPKYDLATLNLFGGGPDLTAAIISQLKVTRDLKAPTNSILEVAFRAPTELAAETVLTAVLEAYQEFLYQTYRSGSDKTLELVKTVRDGIATDLDKKEQAYRDFRSQTPVELLKGSQGNTFNSELLMQIYTKRQEIQLRQNEIQGRLEEVKRALQQGRPREEQIAMISQLSAKSMSTNAATAYSFIYSLEDKLLPAMLEEKMLAENYGLNHPQIQATQKKIELASNYVLQTLQHELEDLKKSEQLLTASFEKHTEEAKKAVSRSIKDDGLFTDLQRTRQLYDVSIKRIQDADIVGQVGGFEATTLGPAQAQRVAPRAFLIGPIALALGLLLGTSLAFVAESADKTFRSAEEIRRRLALPIVGHVPIIQLKQENLEKIASRGSAVDPVLCAYHKPKSREAEAYRGIRTSLYFSSRSGGHKVIQVTSPNLGDGKSTLIANLAISLAQSGKRVILIDADLRRPVIHKLFGLARAEQGLTGVLTGECEYADAIQATEVPGLSLLTCGPLPPNPAELLITPKFQEMVNALREKYDFVLIDTPPLLAVTDPSTVAASADGVLLTLRISKNGRPQAERAKEILETLSANTLGVVVNGVAQRGAGYYGYDYYYYGSYKGYYGYYGYHHKKNGSKDGHGGYYESYYEEDPSQATEEKEKGKAESAPPSGDGKGE